MNAAKQRWTFLSYSRSDKDFALELTKELKSAGFFVWLDQLDIPTGARWDDEVEKALHESEIFLIILTHASISSENVKDEIGYAIDHGKRILPVLLEECEVPLRLRRFQYVDFTKMEFGEGVKRAKQLLENFMSTGSAPVVMIEPTPEVQKTQKTEVTPSSRLPIQKKPLPRRWIIGGAGILALTALLGASFAVGAIMMFRGSMSPSNSPQAQSTSIATLIEAAPTTILPPSQREEAAATNVPVQEPIATKTPVPPTQTPTNTPTTAVLIIDQTALAIAAQTQFAAEAFSVDRSLSQQARIVYGPGSGSLPYIKDSFTPVFASVTLGDFIAESRFYNPPGPQNYWNYGFAFRVNGWDHSHYRLIVESNGTWILQFVEINGSDVAWNRAAEGHLNNWNVSANSPNKIRLVVKGNTAYFFANDLYVATLDVSAVTTPGDLAIGTGTFANDNSSTPYENFTVWSITP